MAFIDIDEKRELLRKHSILRELSDRDLRYLSERSLITVAETGDPIFLQGDPGNSLMIVISGSVLIFAAGNDGREVVFNIICAGETFGEVALLDGRPRSAEAKALSNVRYLILQRRDLLPILEGNAKACIRLIEVLCERLRQTSDQMASAIFLDLALRLARKLLAFSDHFGENVEEGIRIKLALNQAQLGAMVGASRESINRLLRDWTKAGVLRHEKKHFTIMDIQSLKKIADLIG